MCVYINVCICICIYLCIYTLMIFNLFPWFGSTSQRFPLVVLICVYICVHAYMCLYIYIHTHTHLYAYICCLAVHFCGYARDGCGPLCKTKAVSSQVLLCVNRALLHVNRALLHVNSSLISINSFTYTQNTIHVCKTKSLSCQVLLLVKTCFLACRQGSFTCLASSLTCSHNTIHICKTKSVSTQIFPPVQWALLRVKRACVRANRALSRIHTILFMHARPGLYPLRSLFCVEMALACKQGSRTC